MNRPPLHRFTLVLLLFCAVANSAVAQIATDVVVTASDAKTDTLYVNTEVFANGHGYGRAVVTVSCPKGPVRADRNLRLVFFVSTQGPLGTNLAVQRPVLLSQGQQSVTCEIPFMSGQRWMYYDIGVFEGGADIEDERRTKRARGRNQQAYSAISTNGYNLPAISVITDSPQQASNIQFTGRIATLGRTARANRNSNAESNVVSWDKASTDWRLYLSSACWAISVDALKRLQIERPAVVDALVTYVSSGGVLVVCGGAGSDDSKLAVESVLAPSTTPRWQRVTPPPEKWWNVYLDGLYDEDIEDDEDIEPRYYVAPNGQVLPIPSSGVGGYGMSEGASYGGESTEDDDGETDKSGDLNEDERDIHIKSRWKNFKGPITARGTLHDAALLGETILAGRYKSSLDLFHDLAYSIGGSDYDRSWTSVIDLPREKALSALSQRQFLVADVLSGQIIASNVPIGRLEPQNLYLFASNRSPVPGAAASSDYDGNWFFRNLIAAVGKPPVWTFCALIAVFGLVIGPGLLYITGRKRRRSLLILSVPCLSLIATLAIVLYGTLHEGFESHSKVNSVQWIDSETGSGFAWSRQSYYCGARPEGGLVFPAGAYLRPVSVDQGPFSINPRDVEAGRLSEDAEGVRLRNWVKLRYQQQLMVGHEISDAQLPVQMEVINQERVRFINKTDFELPLVVYALDENTYFMAEDIAAAAQVEVKAEPAESVMGKIARIVVDIKPQSPPELRSGSGSLMNFGSNYWSNTGEESDILNSAYKKYLSDQMEPGDETLVVLSRGDSHVPLALEGKMDTSLHLMIGEVKWKQ